MSPVQGPRSPYPRFSPIVPNFRHLTPSVAGRGSYSIRHSAPNSVPLRNSSIRTAVRQTTAPRQQCAPARYNTPTGQSTPARHYAPARPHIPASQCTPSRQWPRMQQRLQRASPISSSRRFTIGNKASSVSSAGISNHVQPQTNGVPASIPVIVSTEHKKSSCEKSSEPLKFAIPEGKLIVIC